MRCAIVKQHGKEAAGMDDQRSTKRRLTPEQAAALAALLEQTRENVKRYRRQHPEWGRQPQE